MRKIVAAACGALLVFSAAAPAVAQTAGSPTPAASESSAVTYDNGLQALGQAPPDQNQNQPGGDNTGLWVGGGLLIGLGITAAVIQSNKNNSVSP